MSDYSSSNKWRTSGYW